MATQFATKPDQIHPSASAFLLASDQIDPSVSSFATHSVDFADLDLVKVETGFVHLGFVAGPAVHSFGFAYLDSAKAETGCVGLRFEIGFAGFDFVDLDFAAKVETGFLGKVADLGFETGPVVAPPAESFEIAGLDSVKVETGCVALGFGVALGFDVGSAGLDLVDLGFAAKVETDFPGKVAGLDFELGSLVSPYQFLRHVQQLVAENCLLLVVARLENLRDWCASSLRKAALVALPPLQSGTSFLQDTALVADFPSEIHNQRHA